MFAVGDDGEGENMRIHPVKGFAAFILWLALISFAGAETDTNSANYNLPACRDYGLAMGGDRQLMDDFLQNPGRLMKANVCAGQILGISQVLEVMGQICAPALVTMGQSVALVVNYIERIPERWHENFTILAIEALIRAWPCHH
jgi:hypothetical protein